MKKQVRFIGALLFLLLAATACGAAAVEPTAVPPPVNTPDADSEHVDDLNDPAHVHLDDGSTLSTESAAPLEDDIWELLLAGDPIVVGAANGSMETAVLTIPTVF